MSLINYTEKRADLLRRMQIPNISNQIGLRLLWLDVLSAEELDGITFKKTHFHSFFEIHFIYDGTISYECGGESVEISDNRAVFIRPNEPHRCTGYTRGVKKLSLAFSLDETEKTRGFFDGGAPRLVETSDSINAVFEDIFLACDDDGPITPAIISGKLFSLLKSVFEFLDIKLHKREDTDEDPRIVIAKRFIRNNLHRPISTADVARECCLSAKQLGRVFEEGTGLSVFSYVTAARIEYVKGLLLQRRYSVKEISYMAGFENASSFVLFFKRHTGTTPGKFISDTNSPEK